MGSVRRLDDMTWPAISPGAPVVVIPVGSCEQHGRHLPLATDTLIATALAERAVATIDGALLGPALTVTASGEHQGFPGTLSIGNDAMEFVVVELVRSADWARGVVLVNGHGGNHTAIEAACRRLTDEGRRVLAWWPRPITGWVADLHAGHLETSLMLAIAPDLVDRDAATPGPPIGRDALTRLRSDGVRSVSPDGVLGDPSAATADDGHAILAHLVDDLVSAVRATTERWDGT